MNALQKALFERISAVGGTALTGGVHHRTAPLETACPLATFAQREQNVERTLNGRIVKSTFVYEITVIDSGESAKAANELFDTIDDDLDNSRLVVEGYNRVTIRKTEGTEEHEEAPDGQLYQRIGALYRIVAT